jgi:hypothetical protein
LRWNRAAGALEHDRDLGHAAAETFARAQVERHARPAARGDLELHGGVRLGRRVGVHAVLFEEPGDLLAALPAAAVLAARRGGGQIVGQAYRGEDLLLLGAQVLRRHRDGLLHRGEGEQLQEVVLDDVARRADAVVVARAPADTDVLGHRDLHVVDVVGVPDRLVQLVGEAQGEDVLHRLLAEVVVDAEDRVGREGDLERGVELARRLQVGAEGLLDDDPTPRIRVRRLVVDEARRFSCFATIGKSRGGIDR